MMTTWGNRTVVAAALLSVLGLAGCSAGQSAPTSQDYDPVDGRNINVPADATFDEEYMAVRNAVVVARDDQASLVVTMVNQALEADVLESASLEGEPLTLSGGPIEFRPGQSVSLGFDDNATATQQPFGISPGDWVDLTLNFTRAGTAELQVLVVPYGDEYVPVQFADQGSNL